MFHLELLCLILIINLSSMVNGYPSDLQNDQCLNYCSNNAVCLMVENKATCYCLPEWEGERCDLARTVDQHKQVESKQMSRVNLRNTPCSFVPNLCNQRGTCFIEDNKMACKCSYPYDGARCTEVSVCYQYCFNNGVCNEEGAGAEKKAKCECKPGYEGARCQLLQSTITAEPTTTTAGTTTTDVICSFLPEGYCNTGQCVVVGSQIVCQCPSTHTGEYCETPVGGAPNPSIMIPPMTNFPTNQPMTNFPTNQPMTNFPTNQPMTNFPTNQPMTNFPTNQPMTNFPTNQPMTNFPTNQPMTNVPGTPPPGTTCLNKPCQNGATCFNNGNSYFCYCSPQYTGINCESFMG